MVNSGTLWIAGCLNFMVSTWFSQKSPFDVSPALYRSQVSRQASEQGASFWALVERCARIFTCSDITGTCPQIHENQFNSSGPFARLNSSWTLLLTMRACRYRNNGRIRNELIGYFYGAFSIRKMQPPAAEILLLRWRYLPKLHGKGLCLDIYS